MLNRTLCICALCVIGAAEVTYAQVGELTGSGPGNTFSITIRQGGDILLQDNDVPFPSDIKTPGLTHVTLDDSLGTWENDITLQIHSEGGAEEQFRVSHWYIDTTGNDSLFDPLVTDEIEVEISGIRFTNGANIIPYLLNQDDYYVSYFMDEYGRFYQTPGTNIYGTYHSDPWEKKDVQVPGNEYLDSTLNPYGFLASPGTEVSWTWKNIIPPGSTTLAIDNDGNSHANDFVYEMGLAVSYVVVPEPATLTLFMGLLPLMIWGGRRRRGVARP
jgi:hypothetical protein